MSFTWPTFPDSNNPSIIAEVERWTDVLHSSVDAQEAGDLHGHYREIIANELLTILSQKQSLESQETLDQFYRFLTTHRNVKPTEESWSTVVGAGVKAYSFKIQGNTKARVPDDKIYQENPILQHLLPRGLVISIEPSGKKTLLIFSNRKFYGRKCGDDDDCNLTSKEIRSDAFVSFLRSEKANGENCQVGLYHLKGESLWVIGSKNRKLVARTAEDLKIYADQMPYSYAVRMAETFFAYLASISAERVKELRDFLTTTGLTLNFEYESPEHQHIVPLFTKRLVLIGCTGIHIPDGWSSHPIVGHAVAKRFGFATVLTHIKTYPRAELNNVCDAINREWNTEGSVLVLLDSRAKVIEFVKVKAWWYVLLRAMREKIRHINKKAPLFRANSLIVSRFNVLKSSMNISADIVEIFCNLSGHFLDWLFTPANKISAAEHQKLALLKISGVIEMDEETAASSSSSSSSSSAPAHSKKGAPAVAPATAASLAINTGASTREMMADFPRFEVSLLQYPIAWRLFLESSGLPETADLLRSRVQVKTGNDELDGKKLPLLVLLQGIPGIGKSYFAINIAQALSKRGIKSIQTAQDDFDHLGKRASKACQEFVEQALLSRENGVVFLARNNSNIQQYRSYLDFDHQGICKVLFLCPKDLIDRPAESVYASMASVLSRKAKNETHPTNTLENHKLATLPLKFFGELDTRVATLRVDFFKNEPLLIPDLPLMNELIRKASNLGFKLPDLEPKQLQRLGLDNPETIARAASFHRPIDEITNDVCDMIQRLSGENIPSFGSYQCLLWDPEFSERILNFVHAQHFGQIVSKWTFDADHVTLMHSNGFLNDPAHWNRIEALPSGTVINVKPLTVVYRPEKLVTVRVSLTFQNDNSPADDLVISSIPHITIARASGVSAVASADVLRNPLPTDVVINVDGVLPSFTSAITNRFAFD